MELRQMEKVIILLVAAFAGITTWKMFSHVDGEIGSRRSMEYKNLHKLESSSQEVGEFKIAVRNSSFVRDIVIHEVNAHPEFGYTARRREDIKEYTTKDFLGLLEEHGNGDGKRTRMADGGSGSGGTGSGEEETTTDVTTLEYLTTIEATTENNGTSMATGTTPAHEITSTDTVDTTSSEMSTAEQITEISTTSFPFNVYVTETSATQDVSSTTPIETSRADTTLTVDQTTAQMTVTNSGNQTTTTQEVSSTTPIDTTRADTTLTDEATTEIPTTTFPFDVYFTDTAATREVSSTGISIGTYGTDSFTDVDKTYPFTTTAADGQTSIGPDIDECNPVDGNDCHADAECLNTTGSFVCTCHSGFTGNGTFCQDVDECESMCKYAGSVCINSIGSFNCSCDYGYEESAEGCRKVCPECPDHSQCLDPNNNCECDEGFENIGNFTAPNCTDIDECSLGEVCQDSEHRHECSNTPSGSYSCDCLDDYFENMAGICQEIPSVCEPTKCSSQASCTDESGDCICNAGWDGEPNTECTDLDECVTKCLNATETCFNEPGSYTCNCIEGYRRKTAEDCEPITCKTSAVSCEFAPEGLCTDLNIVITFPEARCGFEVPSENDCESGAAYGTRKCNSKCEWGDVKWLSSCNTSLEGLATISSEDLTEENRKQIADDLAVLTSKSEELTAYDVVDTVDALDAVTDTGESITTEISESVVYTIGNLLNSPDSVAQSGESEKLLSTLNDVGKNVELTGGPFKETNDKLSMVVMEKSSKGGHGLVVLEPPEEAFREDLFVLTENKSAWSGEKYEGRIVNSRMWLPQTLFDLAASTKVSFVTFSDDILFQRNPTQRQPQARAMILSEDDWAIKSFILSVDLPEEPEGTPQPLSESLATVSLSLFEPLNVTEYCEPSDLARCVIWNGDEWSPDGITTTNANEQEVQCELHRLGDVAVTCRACIIVCHEELDIPVVAGCSTSIFILSLYFVVVAIYPKSFRGVRFRSAYTTLNVLLASMAANVVMLVMSLPTPRASCIGVAASLHVFLIATFALLNFETLNLFVTLAKPNWVRKRILREVLIPGSIAWGWFIPVLLVLILSLVDGTTYVGQSRLCQVCWITEGMRVWLVVTPLCILLGINLVIYAAIVNSIVRHKTITKIQTGCSTYDLWMNLIMHVIFTLVVTVTWVFGLQVIVLRWEEHATFSFIFAFADIAQALLLIYFFAGRNTNAFKSYLSITYRDISPYDNDEPGPEIAKNPYADRFDDPPVNLRFNFNPTGNLDTDLSVFTGLPRAKVYSTTC